MVRDNRGGVRRVLAASAIWVLATPVASIPIDPPMVVGPEPPVPTLEITKPDNADVWKIVAAMSALASVIVSAGGLLLIRQQLVQTRSSLDNSVKSAQAAAEAARIAFQHSRPWIKLSLAGRNAEIFFTPSEPDSPQVAIPVRHENVGQTPALGFITITRGIRDPHKDNGAAVQAAWQEMLSTDWHPQTAVFPNEGGEVGHGVWLPWPEDVDSANFVVLIGALYKSAIEDPWHGTPLVVMLHGPQPTGQPSRMAAGLRFPVLLTSGHNFGTYPS